MARRRKSHSTTDTASSGPEANAAAEKKASDKELADRWLKAIEERRDAEKKWRTEQAPKVVARYRDDRDSGNDATRFNIFWANTETLKPAIFARMPVPDVRRRYSTRDPAARTAALILERALSYSIECGELEDVLDRSVEDYTVPGRGVSVVRYKPTIESRTKRIDAQPLPSDESGDESPPRYPKGTEFDEDGTAYTTEQVDEVIYHEVYGDYQPWDLFVFGQGRSWKKVPWVALGSLLTQTEVKAQYKNITPEQLKAIPFTHSQRESKDGHSQSGRYALFWDVWDKTHRKFIVVADGYTAAPIYVADDPLGLEEFFPVPEPMYSLRTNRDWTPKPEFLLYQDQAIELDEATERLTALTKALKVRGVYDKTFDNEENKSGLGSLLSAPDLTLVPIDNFRALVEKGGLKAIIDTLPLAEIAGAIDKLRQRVIELKAVIDEVTGISDIVRGKTVASETLGAQQLKAQYSGLRISKRQQRFQRYCRDIFRIMAEIIAEHYDPETLRIISGVQVLPDQIFQQQKAQGQLQAGTVAESEFAQAIQILRSDKLRGFKVEVETDSTVPADKEGEQQKRVEFLGMVAQYLQQAMPAVQAGLVPAPVVREGLLFGVRAFKIGSEFEEVLEQLGQNENEEGLRKRMQQLQQQLAQMQEQGQKLAEENSSLKSKQAESMRKAEVDAEIAQYRAQIDAGIAEREAEQERRLKEADAAQDRRLKEWSAQLDQRLNAMSAAITNETKAREAERKSAQPRQDQSAKQFAELAKRQDALGKSLEAVMKAVGELAAGAKAPKRRKGRASLPSGGVMDFEIEDGVGRATMPNGQTIEVATQ